MDDETVGPSNYSYVWVRPSAPITLLPASHQLPTTLPAFLLWMFHYLCMADGRTTSYVTCLGRRSNIYDYSTFFLLISWFVDYLFGLNV